MCGRFTLAVPAEEIADLFEVEAPPQLPLRYNIAPTQQTPVVRATEEGRELALPVFTRLAQHVEAGAALRIAEVDRLTAWDAVAEKGRHLPLYAGSSCASLFTRLPAEKGRTVSGGVNKANSSKPIPAAVRWASAATASDQSPSAGRPEPW